MSTKIVTGHFATENEQYVIVTQRSERPLGAVLGFVIGCLIVLVMLDNLTVIEILLTLLVTVLIGAIFSSSSRSESIPRHRVVSIQKSLGRVDVVYVIHDDPILDLLER